METPNIISKPPIFNPDNPTIIFSMEKCGTTTIMEAIKSVGLEAHRATTENIKSLPHQDSRIITMVRDPIAWAISYYWEMPDAHPEELVEPERFGSVENFMLNVNLDKATTWLDEYFREIIGVHTYGQHFPKSKGWRIYSLDRILVLNTHKLSFMLPEALGAFLGERYTRYFVVLYKAQGIERHGEQYQEFIEKVKFPRTFLHDLYEGKYCFHFFDFEVRKRWLEKWVK